MALPGYVKIEAEEQGLIEGECVLEGRKGAIIAYACDHSVKLPTDNRGLVSGKRMHMPITILKDIDRTTPMLYQALNGGELLNKVVIEWYRIDSAGNEELYFTQTLHNAQIIAVNFSVEFDSVGADSRLGHMEKVSFIYDRISWVHEVDGIEFEDNFGADS
ncbi:type VI secretion system tube protein TssD [Bacterioplanoides sp.]|uniref:type VI secretion system tube protein TssD n=1 Tax=Bacterioplanoides sp. TaxID=2066072 RepID=UPI003B006DEE